MTATLVAFSGGRTRREGADSAADALDVSQDELLRQINMLEEIGLLATAASDPDPLADQWRRHGWIAAYDHHLTTWDFPLVDYTADGWKVDQSRMKSYGSSEPDPGPLAHDYCAKSPTSLHLAEAASIDLTAPLTTVLHNTEASDPLIRGGCAFCSRRRSASPTRRQEEKLVEPARAVVLDIQPKVMRSLKGSAEYRMVSGMSTRPNPGWCACLPR
ncbi:MAG: hypothetical protein ACRDRI_17350 [Pseudonocardiaceae bacterium]